MYVFLITWKLRPETLTAGQSDELLATITASSEEQARLLVRAALVGGPKIYRATLGNAVNPDEFTVRQVKFPSMMLKPVGS